MEENNQKTTFKQKMEDLKWKAEQKVMDTARWIKENPVVASGIALTVAKLGVDGLKYSSRLAEAKNANRNRDRHPYDPSLGIYYDLKRPLKSKEKIEVARRRKNGDTLYEIYKDLGLI